MAAGMYSVHTQRDSRPFQGELVEMQRTRAVEAENKMAAGPIAYTMAVQLKTKMVAGQ